MIKIFSDGLSTDTIRWILQDPERAARVCVAALNAHAGAQVVEVENLLSEVETVEVPGTECFVAAKKFRVGKGTGGAHVCLHGEGFKRSFLGLEETLIGPATLRIQNPKKGLSCEALHEQLGDTNISLAHFWELLKRRRSNPGLIVAAPCNGQLLYAGWKYGRHGCLIDAVPFTDKRFRVEECDQIATY